MAITISSIQTEPPQPTGGLDSPPPPVKLVMWPGNTQALFIFGAEVLVVGSDPPLLIPDAGISATATLVDGQGNPVTGLNGITFHSMGSPANGDYYALVGATFNPPLAGDYLLQIAGTDGGGEVIALLIPVEVEAREN